MQTVLEGATTAPEALRAQSALWNDQQARMRERDEELPIMHLARNEEDIEAARRAMEQAEELLEDQSIAMRARQPESIRWQEEREEAASLSAPFHRPIRISTESAPYTRIHAVQSCDVQGNHPSSRVTSALALAALVGASEDTNKNTCSIRKIQ